ncbi:MAG: FAD-dependent oxidoreductase [Balneolaceae bacterium]|nr:FAD-dependent oxidoreductase [Balneolaceae bacterium]
MKIGVIGAGIAGLAAGRELAKAGHEVIVYEKSTDIGGRMACRYAGEQNQIRMDHGLTYLSAESSWFKSFLEELQVHNILQKWEGEFAYRNTNGEISLYHPECPYFIAPEGMNAVGKHLGRMLDVRTGTNVGGFTHIGEHSAKKRTWMINFSSSRTEGVDALIIATPSRQAYGLLNTTIDEIETLNLVKEIDEVIYKPQFAVLAGYGNTDLPDWNALKCEDDIIEWVSNESTKRKQESGNALVIQTTGEFAGKHATDNKEEISEIVTDRLGEMIGGWAALPEWKQIQLWKYSQSENPLNHDFMEIEGKDTPLALVGDYLNGNTIESAYLSGLKLGKHWCKKYPV